MKQSAETHYEVRVHFNTLIPTPPQYLRFLPDHFRTLTEEDLPLYRNYDDTLLMPYGQYVTKFEQPPSHSFLLGLRNILNTRSFTPVERIVVAQIVHLRSEVADYDFGGSFEDTDKFKATTSAEWSYTIGTSA